MNKLRANLIAKRIKNLKPSATGEVDNEIHRLKEEGVSDLVSLGIGEPKFDTPLNVKSAAIKAIEEGKTKYEPTAGDYSLRKAISEKLERENNISTSPEDIIVTAGAKFAIYLAFHSTLERGDKVIVIDPAWVTYEPAAEMAGAEVVRVSTKESRGFHPDLREIEEAMDDKVKILVINSPCNPTGAVYKEAEIKRIAEIARDYNSLVLSDEPYEYLVFDGEHYSPGSDFENVITVNSFSKSFAMTGWRLGYVTGPKEILEGIKKIYQHSLSCVTAFAQSGGLEALESKETKLEVQKMLTGYEQRRELAITKIKESNYLEQEIKPEGAFYCFPSYSINMPSGQLAKKLLKEYHVATVPGGAFGECGEGHLRLSYSGDIENIEESFKRMEDFFSRCEKKG